MAIQGISQNRINTEPLEEEKGTPSLNNKYFQEEFDRLQNELNGLRQNDGSSDMRKEVYLESKLKEVNRILELRQMLGLSNT